MQQNTSLCSLGKNDIINDLMTSPQMKGAGLHIVPATEDTQSVQRWDVLKCCSTLLQSYRGDLEVDKDSSNATTWKPTVMKQHKRRRRRLKQMKRAKTPKPDGCGLL